jgi:hypothetical protein
VTLDRAYFDHLYGAETDPWGFKSRWYEQRKRAVTLSALTRQRYGNAFEPGCSIGVMTRALADRCDHVVAMDVAGRALAEAAKVVPGHVDLRSGAVPEDWPRGRFDLVVLSELAYYLDEAACRRLAEAAAACSTELVAVHWRHPVGDYPLTGDQAHSIIGAAARAAGFTAVATHDEMDFRLETWCTDSRSVAERAGLVDQ